MKLGEPKAGSRVLCLLTVDIQTRKFFAGEGFPVYCKMFNSIPGLNLPEASRNLSTSS